MLRERAPHAAEASDAATPPCAWTNRRVQVALLFVVLLIALSDARAQKPEAASSPSSVGTTKSETVTPLPTLFRLERTPVTGGAELLTVFGSLRGTTTTTTTTNASTISDDADVPLVTILRDTLGDQTTDNDRLRYVWMHTYARPQVGQRFAAAVPFLYTRVWNKGSAQGDVPLPLLDLGDPQRDVWQRLFWATLQSVLLDPISTTVKASTRTYRRNAADYRKAHVIRALAVLALYQTETGAGKVFTAQEAETIQARLLLSEKTLGGLVDDTYLQRVYQKQSGQRLDMRGHNWELLRQRAEAEGFYFEPLELPDGSATHALLWIAKPDLEVTNARRFDGRFLSFVNPWGDARLRHWQGYTETRYFDGEQRRVTAATPGARAVEMIPLALYGLDYPKIPILLVDFRDDLNPKRREVSQRILQDVARNVLAVSRFDLPYLIGRAVYDFVTERRGADINQSTRLRAYSQLKLLLALNDTLDPRLRVQIAQRAERVSLNPLENDVTTEAKLARQQYAALLDYASRPDGLPKRLDVERRAELARYKQGRAAQTIWRLANTLSFGLYTHRQSLPPEQQAAALDAARKLAHHRTFLRQVAKSSTLIEVEQDLAEVRRALQYVADAGTRADGKTADAVARIFAHTNDEATRRLCLASLYRINNETAKSALVRIYRDDTLNSEWHDLSAQYLRTATREAQRVSAADAKLIAAMSGQ